MINFIKYRMVTAIVSVLLIGGFFGLVIYKKQTTGEVFRYSIDFTGGAQVLLKFSQPVSMLAIKDILDQEGWDGAALREFGSDEILVRIKLDQVSKDLGQVAEIMQSAVQNALPDTQVTVLQSESVGPEVGETLRGKSFRAVLLAMLAMLAYIAFSFWSFGFAVGAVVALIHDAILVLAVFLLFDREISINVIGAILAVIGYSVNDTIIIFSQIRDNVKKMSHDSLSNIVNVSLNQTLRRTLLTSFSTAIAVVSMFVLGGEALRDFSLSLLVGIIV
ncbi:MAG TPA: protein translocase subunit SecF, partial [Candidatus Babeliales bacterium]|nr:protein translocase subunit SecF [Candidatus Babeliales bacterium]